MQGGFDWVQAYAPAVAALFLAGAGSAVVRGRVGWVGIVGTAAVLVGWGLMAGSVPAAVWPRGLMAYLVLPAGAALVASVLAIVGPGWAVRWAPAAALAFGAWWVSGAPCLRAEGWRAGFAVLVLGWLLRRVDAGLGGRALMAGMALAGGVLVAGGSQAWAMAGLVLAGAGAGVMAGGADGRLPVGVLALGIVVVDGGTGRFVRGGVGIMDLVCCGVVAAALLAGWVERRLGRLVAPAVLAGGAVAGAWVVGRALRV